MEDEPTSPKRGLSVGVSAGLQDRGDGARLTNPFLPGNSSASAWQSCLERFAAASIRLPPKDRVRWRAFRRGLRWRSPQRVALRIEDRRGRSADIGRKCLQHATPGCALRAWIFSMAFRVSSDETTFRHRSRSSGLGYCQTARWSERHARSPMRITEKSCQGPTRSRRFPPPRNQRTIVGPHRPIRRGCQLHGCWRPAPAARQFRSDGLKRAEAASPIAGRASQDRNDR